MTTATRRVTDDALRAMGLSQPDHEADKEGRGNVLVVAGSREVPGAALLAATASLRAGAGRLAMAVPASVAVPIAIAMPEARVVALPELPSGGLAAEGVDRLASMASRVDAVLVGPGLMDEAATEAFARSLLAVFDVPVVLDAAALVAVRSGPPHRAGVVVTPHAGEMAHLTGLDKAEVQRDAAACARQASDDWHAGVVLKGASTCIAFPGEPDWQHDGGDVGLATSGSGDTLAGILVGLLARGVPLCPAALWAVRLHALAGERLARRHGRLGYLARELGDEVPAAMHGLCAAAADGAG